METLDYEKQATAFLQDTGATFKTTFLEHKKHFADDAATRDVYKFTFKRNGKSFSGSFGQCLTDSNGNGTNPPTAYDVLACLTKYDPGNFGDFCRDFGYDEDSRTAERIYRGVQKEWDKVSKMFGDVIEQLQEIQ